MRASCRHYCRCTAAPARKRDPHPGAERLQGATQLVRFGPVLGVVNYCEGAARERQRNVERLRFGARPLRRHRDRRDRQAVVACGESLARFAVVSLDGDDHVELLGRIVKPLDRPQQSVDRGRFAVERGDHGKNRQGVAGEVGRRLAGPAFDKGTYQPQAKPGQEHRGQRYFKRKHRPGRRHHGGGKRQQRDRRNGNDIRAPARRSGGQLGHFRLSRLAARATIAERRGPVFGIVDHAAGEPGADAVDFRTAAGKALAAVGPFSGRWVNRDSRRVRQKTPSSRRRPLWPESSPLCPHPAGVFFR